MARKLKETKMEEDYHKSIVIIKHQSGNGFFAFDILIKDRDSSFIDSNQGYKLECRYVKKYQEKNPRMVYLFSEDDGHIPEFNWIKKYVQELVSKGALLIKMDKDDL